MKSWQARFIPIADPVAEAFARLAARGEFTGEKGYVLCSRRGRPLDGWALRRRFKAAAAAAGIRVLGFDALRHRAGSTVARHTDARSVQGFLGHSKLATTDLPTKVRPQDVELLNRAFAGTRQVITMPSDTLERWISRSTTAACPTPIQT